MKVYEISGESACPRAMIDTSGPSESDPVTLKRHPVPLNELDKFQADTPCPCMTSKLNSP